MKETKIVYELYENWEGGKSNGYFDPFKNEIHVLNGTDLEARTVFHESVHAARQDKLTFRFAEIFSIPILTNFLFGVLMVLAVAGVFTSVIPFFFAAGLFSFFLFCFIYEEYKADSLTARAFKKELKE